MFLKQKIKLKLKINQNENYTGDECHVLLLTGLESAEKLFDLPVVRVLCTDLPQYLAVVSRVRVDCRTLGPAGGILSSSVVPQAQVVFPQDALVKPIRVGLQVRLLACPPWLTDSSDGH